MKESVEHPHEPVLIEEVLTNLITRIDGAYLDCTIGFGGHSSKILDKLNQEGILIGMDYDPYALEYSNNRLSSYRQKVKLFLSNYKDIKQILKSLNIKSLDGVLFDLGVSSHQVDSGHKGLSYRIDSPLDMKMDENGSHLRDFLNNSNEKEIADVIYCFGEERGSRRIAKSIYEYKKNDKMNTNMDLVNAVKESVPERYLNKTLSRVFQAFRIKMNNELNNIFNSIVDAIDMLSPGARIAVITFHSIEDRLVKNIFRAFASGRQEYLINMGYNINIDAKTLFLVNKKPISPSIDEIKKNKRARSAKLRVAERI